MKTWTEKWQDIAKNGESSSENLHTQPLHVYKNFNNAKVLTEAWYPVCSSQSLKPGQTTSFKIAAQRLVVFRGHDKSVYALDAFCPHMGADLSRGQVDGTDIRCYFHRWKFSGAGDLKEIPCLKNKLPENIKTRSYPLEERYGYIWVFAGKNPGSGVPTPPGLDPSSCQGRFLLKTQLFVHHHVLMASAIDLQHFSAVHGLDANLDFQNQELLPGVWQWRVSGLFQRSQSWQTRWAKKFFGEQLTYQALFSGGSIVCLSYPAARFFLPALHLMWGSIPLANGTSESYLFVIQKKHHGIFRHLKSFLHFCASTLMLAWLKDDDVKAFPRMRFQAHHLLEQDRSVAQFIKTIENLRRSDWSHEN